MKLSPMPLNLTARELRAIREALNHSEDGNAKTHWLDEIRVEEGPEEFELIKNSIESAHSKIVDEISRRNVPARAAEIIRDEKHERVYHALNPTTTTDAGESPATQGKTWPGRTMCGAKVTPYRVFIGSPELVNCKRCLQAKADR